MDHLEIRRLKEKNMLLIWALGAPKVSKNKMEILRKEFWENDKKLQELDKENKFRNIHYDDLLPPWPEGQNPWNKKEQKIINNWNKRNKQKP